MNSQRTYIYGAIDKLYQKSVRFSKLIFFPYVVLD